MSSACLGTSQSLLQAGRFATAGQMMGEVSDEAKVWATASVTVLVNAACGETPVGVSESESSSVRDFRGGIE
jgi:hypothetical protein